MDNMSGSSMSTDSGASQPGMLDPSVESLLDLSEYDNLGYQSPSLSPAASIKTPFARTIKTEATTTASLMTNNQPLSGPSHQYDLYKQQTGIVPGALATTLAVNQNSQVPGYVGFDFLGLNTTDDVFDFNTAPSQGSLNPSEMDMEFESPSDNFFFESTINPSSLAESGSMSPPMSQTSQVTRVYPGMHQQQALAKQQQQQQQRQRQQSQQAKQSQKGKSAQHSDPLVEQKITQLLNSMRAKSGSGDASQNTPMLNISRPKKDEDEMDEDERLLASEEGKKLSSKERRQLRNKVSARAFRSRRKEYITQLESEIASKVTENGELRAHNRALIDENKRLTDLTRMLLSSPSFSGFLEQLSQNPQQLAQPQQPVQQQQPQQQQQENRQLPKDVNPYGTQQQMQHQQIGLAMIPEQTPDFSLFGGPVDGFSYQPQVYSVLETPEPVIDFSALSGKTSNFVGEFDSDEEKVEMPIIDSPATYKKEEEQMCIPSPVDEEFENDPAFALYHDSVAPSTASSETSADVELDTESWSGVDLFGGIEPGKLFARLELVDATEEEATAALAIARVRRIERSLEGVLSRLEALTSEL